MRHVNSLFLFAVFLLNAACRERSLPVPVAPPAENEYRDLAAGSRLSVVVPSFKSGGYVAPTGRAMESSGTVTVSGSDLIGFQVSHYAVEGKAA